MSANIQPKKYWAFISYSSKDKKWGQWLHKRLENFPIPKEFQGTQLFDGAVLGKDLKPCFRDRDELSGSAELGPAILKGLVQSRYLIVLCSKNSAKSQWVDKEIEDFKIMGGKKRILALILDGEPNATSNASIADSEECFPPALRYPLEPLAGDMRKEGDGKERGFLKVLSGIAQLDFDALYRRHERAQRKKRAILGTTAISLIAILTTLALVAFTQTKLAETQTRKVEIANAKQDSLLLEASRGDHEAATRAFNEGKPDDGFAYLARAIRLKSDNDAPKLLAGNRLFGSSVSNHVTRWFANLGGPVSQVAFGGNGDFVAFARGRQVTVRESATGTQRFSMDLEKEVRHLEISRDGEWLAVGDGGHFVQVREVATGREMSLLDFKGEVRSLAFSPDGRWLAAGCGNKIARVLEASTGKEVSSSGIDYSAISMAFSPDGRRLASGSLRGALGVFEPATGKPVLSLQGEDSIGSVAFSPDGRWLAADWGSGTARVFEAETFTHVSSLKLGDFRSNSMGPLVFSPDGGWITASGDKSARVFDVASGKEISSLEVGSTIRCVAFSPDGRWLAGGGDGTVQVIETATGRPVSRLKSGRDIACLAFSPDGRWLALGAGDGSASVLETAIGRHVNPLEFGDIVTGVDFSPDGRRIAAGSGDGTVRLADAATGAKLATLDLGEKISSVAYSPDGRRLAVGGWQGMAWVHDIASGGQVSSMGFGGLIRNVTFSPDGKWLTATVGDRTVRVFEAATGNPGVTMDFGADVMGVVFSPDGRWLAAGGMDKTARIFDVITGRQHVSHEFEAEVVAVAFSPDSRWFAAAVGDGTTRVFDAATGGRISELSLESAATGVAFAPDGEKVAVAGMDGSVRVFGVATGVRLSALDVGGLVLTMEFSPDGRWLAVGGKAVGGKAVQLFEVETGKQVFSREFGDILTRVSFSRDGRWLAASSRDKTVKVFDARWWDTGRFQGVDWPELLENASGLVFDSAGKLVPNPRRKLTGAVTRVGSGSAGDRARSPILDWLATAPESRMSSPWSDVPLRKQAGEVLIGTTLAETLYAVSDQTPWHPLVPVSLARSEEDPLRKTFLAGLTLGRLRAADPGLWGSETLALYFVRAAAWMDGMGLEQVALDTAEEALRLNPDNPAVIRCLANAAVRMGDKEKSLEYYRILWASEEPLASDFYDPAYRHAQVGEREDSAAIFSAGERRFGTDPGFVEFKGWSFVVLGEGAMAVREFEKAVALGDGGITDDLLAGLAVAHLLAGDEAKAVSRYQQLRERDEKWSAPAGIIDLGWNNELTRLLEAVRKLSVGE